MKWRPISELSHYDNSGKWVLFAFKTTARFHIEEYRLRIGWHEEDEGEVFGWFNDANNFISIDNIHSCFSHFLSESLPAMRMPMRMEWRKFEDEWPEEGQEVFVFGNSADVCVCKGDLLIQCGADKDMPDEYPRNSDCHWMPIIPPEDK